jgi:hypothetical protein
MMKVLRYLAIKFNILIICIKNSTFLCKDLHLFVKNVISEFWLLVLNLTKD